MGRNGALGAALVAAGVVLSGCASADGEEGPTSTTSPAAAEESGDPWDLPIEQRPALFDPCAQVPIEAVEGGLGAPVQPVEEFFNHRPDELISCGWESAEAHFTVLSTWKSREEYLSDEMFDLRDESAEVMGREGMRLSKSTDAFNSTCLQLFFTSQGTVWFELGLTNALNEFRGERTADACSVIGRTIEPLVPLIPEGDFQ